MRNRYSSRILAVDIRSRRFGYAIFETPAELLDSGTARLASPQRAAVRISGLCRVFRPSLLVLRKESVRRRRSYPRTNAVRRAIRKEATRRSTAIATLEGRAVNNWLRQHGSTDKYGNALFLANLFPELSWKLPPRRKLWQPEPWSLCLFDAVALGLVFVHTYPRESHAGLRVLN